MKTSYEIQTLQRGRWKITSIFDEFDLAVYEAKRIDNAGRFRSVRVIKEDIEGNPFAQNIKAKLSVVYAGGDSAAAPQPQPRPTAPVMDEPGFGGRPRRPPPIPDIPELSTDGDLSTGRGSGRRRRKKKQDNTLVIVLLILVGVLLLTVVYLGLRSR